MRKVDIAGVSMSKFCISEKTQIEMAAEAAMEALSESNLKPKDIQALFLGNASGDMEENQNIMGGFIADDLGISGVPAPRFESACSSGSWAIATAAIWVASGFFDIVLAVGTERQSVLSLEFNHRMMGSGVHSFYESPTGLSFPGVFGMAAHLYAHKYGIPLKRLKECLAKVAIKNHKNGSKNAKAQFQKEISFEDYYNSMPVATPLQLYDCCPISDGASAVVITTADIAKKLVKKPVEIVGIGSSSSGALCGQKDFTRVKAREMSAKMAYNMSGITPKEIDVAELHDCFTIAEVLAIEGLGFFDPGDGYKAIERGDTEIGGNMPCNTSGGLKAKGHPVGATGPAQVYEITRQIRGECGSRQVDGATTGITDTMGGSFAAIVSLILKKGW